MALTGLRRRHALCKICISFEDEVLNDITLDLLLSRRTYAEIMEHYDQYLLEEMPRLNTGNLVAHRNHADPALIAEGVLAKRGEAVTNGDHAAVLFAQRFTDRIDKNVVVNALYQNRINNVQVLRDMMNDKVEDFQLVRRSQDPIHRSKRSILEKEVRSYISQVDNIERDLQDTIISEMRVEKGPGHTTINNQTNINFTSGLKSFMGEFIPYLLYQVFPEDIEKGKAVVAKLSAMMDKNLSSIFLEPQKQITNRVSIER